MEATPETKHGLYKIDHSSRWALRAVGSLSVPESPFLADIVAKVENQANRKISRKLIFGLLCRCVAFPRHYGGP
jgi:hypothetical protein